MGLMRRARKQVRRIALRRRLADTQGESDILDTLKSEHDEICRLLQALVETQSGTGRKKLVNQIKTALIPHQNAEEKVVYKSVLKLRSRRVRQNGEEGLIEHRLTQNMLAGLAKSQNTTSPHFAAAAKVLKELMEHHVEEEEKAIWSDVREHFSLDERRWMNRRFEAAKERARPG